MIRLILFVLLYVWPLGAAAIECPEALECPDGGTFRQQGNALWCTKGGQGHGPHITCDQSGNLIVRDHYRNGTRHGRHQRFTASGKLLIDETFVDGVVDGVAKGWHPGGAQLAYEIEMKRGQQHGLEQRWHPNGVLEKRASFVHGKQHGRTEMWYPNGSRRLIATYREGEPHGTRQQYHANNWISEFAQFDRGQLVGEYFRFTDDGKPEVRGQYEAGLKVGDWLDGYGRGPARGRYRAGKKVGEWRVFTADQSQLVLVEHFDDDLLHGPFERYEQGTLVEKGAHEHNLRDGTWETFVGGEVATRQIWDVGMLLESCERKRGKMRCEKHMPYRIATLCSTTVPESRFVSSADQFEKLVQCHNEAPIDWTRHHVYIHRDEVDPYALRFAGLEADGAAHRLIFDQHVVCYGHDPGPAQPRWIVVVLDRTVTKLGEPRVQRVPAQHSCEGVP